MLLAVCAATTLLSAQEQERVVRGLRFVGNKALDDYTLESAIATTKSSAWARYTLVRWIGLGEKRYFNEVEFRRDVVRLILLYRQSGYMNAVVDTSVQRTSRDVYITFRIHEGDPVRVERLEINGLEGIADVAKLKRDLPLHVGDPFNRFLMQASADTIVARLRNSGYPYAEVLRNFDSEAGILRADIELDALPGPRMRIGEVQIRGLRRVDTSAVKRVMSLRPGTYFKQDALYQTQRDLYGIGVFNSVNVQLIDSVAPQETVPRDSTVRTLIQVQEGPAHQVRVGGGYATVECFRVQSGWTAHNFLGGARALDLSAKVSRLGAGTPKHTTGFNQFCNPFSGTATIDTLDYTFGVGVRQPAFLKRSHVLNLGFIAERTSEFGVYKREAVGGNADVTFNARGRLPFTLGYTYAVGRTTASDAIYCSLFRLCDEASRKFLRDRRQFGAISASISRDRVNNVLDPSFGSVTTVTILHASRTFGSQPPYEFNRAEVETARYHLIGRSTVFAWRVRGGTILPKNITLNGQAVGYVPPDQRFYGGGPTSVRGYGRNELGPRVYFIDDSTAFDVTPTGDTLYQGVITAPTGGNSVVIFNAELRVPSPIFPQRMRLGLFVDAGQVWERGEKVVATSGMRVTPGLGVRFATPLGPVRIDAAYNGYPLDRGPLLFVPKQPSTDPVVVLRTSYPPQRAEKTFWQKVVIQFAVGQAF
ncbi:MAG TPA: BamA/TamA family outer membrane protein [Gemmatimonadales bacterium]